MTRRHIHGVIARFRRDVLPMGTPVVGVTRTR